MSSTTRCPVYCRVEFLQIVEATEFSVGVGTRDAPGSSSGPAALPPSVRSRALTPASV
jgi:hypothetical protein